MAGTPTTNYNIPTYADTDAPDLSGAYNDAMVIIDTQMKANADAIESASTGNYTGTNPIVVDNEQRTISVSKARSAQVSAGSVTNYGDKGTLSFAGSADIITAVAGMPGDDKDTVVPNCYALTQYVATHGGTEYTGTAPIIVSGSNIAVARPAGMSYSGNTVSSPGTTGVVFRFPGNTSGSGTIRIIDDESNDWSAGDLAYVVPNVMALKGYVEQKMVAAGAAYTGTAPIVVNNGTHTISVNNAENASTVDGTTTYGTPGTVLVAGNVQTLVGAAADAVNSEHVHEAGRTVPNCIAVKAYTEKQVSDTQKADLEGATQQLTVDKLSNLWVNPTTGSVFYKAPTK